MVSINEVYVAPNLIIVHHGHLALTITAKEYTAQTVYPFVPPHNPGNYPPTTGTSQEQPLRTEKFLQNQAIFRRYTAVDGSTKNIFMEVEPVLLYPLVYYLTGFGQVSELFVLKHIFTSYGEIGKINLK